MSPVTPVAVLLALLTISHLAYAKIEVYIISRVPKAPTSLQIHCQSKDDDLGTHILDQDRIFSWRFNPNFIQTTLFFCSFKWGSKFKSFTVYDRDIDYKCGDNVYWEARTDGFYLSGDAATWEKYNFWT